MSMNMKVIGAVLLAGALTGSVAGAAQMATAAAGPASSVSTVRAAGGDASPLTKPVTDAPGTAFTAYGDTFRVTVAKGRLNIEDARIGERTVTVSRSAFAKGVEFTGTDRGRKVELVVRSGKCVDTAGEDTGMRATFVRGKTTMRGCAVAGVLPIADT